MRANSGREPGVTAVPLFVLVQNGLPYQQSICNLKSAIAKRYSPPGRFPRRGIWRR